MIDPSESKLTEAEIDEFIIAEAGDDSAWDEPVHVIREQGASLTLPADLVTRAAFLARLHREEDLGAWLTKIIQERIELEEGAYLQAKRELAVA
ncbi:MAG: hypothetical protein KDE46_25125 [Caldilineaceae bacterium]|nr:hypothetical protein [Caldilineaceae bacterium]